MPYTFPKGAEAAGGGGGGGWTEITRYVPTTDIRTISWTGLSGYNHIKVVLCLMRDSDFGSEDIIISARVSAGTWRVLHTLVDGSDQNDITWVK